MRVDFLVQAGAGVEELVHVVHLAGFRVEGSGVRVEGVRRKA